MENHLNEKPILRFEAKNGFHATNASSKLMSRIRGKNTVSEVRLRKILWGLGLRFRKNDTRLPGAPDIVLPKYQLVIFIDGEFWHGHNWEAKRKKIKSNANFWIPKIEKNMQRDMLNNRLLAASGWHVMRFWDHEVKKELPSCLRAILNYIEEFDKFP
ncbi:MAG: very short patch repair endonuclease [Dyadobacter sp.]|uniref:very short patch repair endonuclease n=1 Tax=Dyadobacter sp. TaxID=1914288 RepID=UPI001B1BB02A|nr:very short patch repair endonuclease [Dyadobacter sp.]MBO9615415.1 very short patch repair endonuclease [Dyadobacter sp.]